jgi:membrane-bound lytic murein transglycosylase F
MAIRMPGSIEFRLACAAYLPAMALPPMKLPNLREQKQPKPPLGSAQMRWSTLPAVGLVLPLLFLIAASCSSKGAAAPGKSEAGMGVAPVQRDLPAIAKDDTLRVLVNYSSTSYFLYKGQPMGFEYELLKRMADDMGLVLDMVLAGDMDSIFVQLNRGEVDLISHSLTITNERKKKVAFTDYLYLTAQVLVQRKPDNWRRISWSRLQSQTLQDAIDLIGDTVSVRKNSSYMARLQNLSEELGDTIYIDTMPGDMSTEEIIKKVVDGEIRYTIADANVAKVNAAYYPILDVDVPISFSQRIAWAVRKNSPALLAAINEWIENEKKGVDYYVIYNRYFKNKREFKRRIKSDYLSLNSNTISSYDPLIKRYAADPLGWDWRLLASLIYQESRFEPNADSWAGARGLMQIMPQTAEELGLTDRSDPEQSLRGGTRYLKQMHEHFDYIEDSLQRIKFSLAAYNCGLGHVEDAMVLAEQEGLNPELWDDNVDRMLLALSYPRNYRKPGIRYGYVRGIEPVTYVEQIFARYAQYATFIDAEGEGSTAQKTDQRLRPVYAMASPLPKL